MNRTLGRRLRRSLAASTNSRTPFSQFILATMTTVRSPSRRPSSWRRVCTASRLTLSAENQDASTAFFVMTTFRSSTMRFRTKESRSLLLVNQTTVDSEHAPRYKSETMACVQRSLHVSGSANARPNPRTAMTILPMPASVAATAP